MICSHCKLNDALYNEGERGLCERCMEDLNVRFDEVVRKFFDMEDGECPECGGTMTWCESCRMWSKECCEDYGTCECS